MKEKSEQEECRPAPLLRDRARRLRGEQTDAERVLWSHLRDHALGVKFRRQHAIHGFIVDFVSLEAKLVVEIDGGQHDHDGDRAADAQRTRHIEEHGYRVVRFWNNEVLGDIDAVLARIADFL